MIKIEGLEKTYNSGPNEVVALKDINLDVKKGEIAGIIGYSGAGKSTLVRCINLLEKPSRGHVFVDGQEVTGLKGQNLRKARQKIGMIFQHFNLLHSRTVRENIAFPLEIAGWQKNKISERVQDLLQLVGLTDRADAYPSQLSGGQKQRVGIARALANEPNVLLCDEATSALDPTTTKSILALLKDINSKLGLTIMVITHEMQVIKEICNTVSVMEQGRIIESGSVFDIFANPVSKTTQQFVQSLHSLEIPTEFYEQQSREGFHETVKIIFAGNASEPVITSLPQKFGITVNILAGNIDYLQGKQLGTLILELSGEHDTVKRAMQYLIEMDLKLEVMNNGCGKPSAHC